jgi:hypothetical protein
MFVERIPLNPERLEANRRNARKSTGPVSARGRAVSSQNGRKYALLPFENPALPAQLTAQYYGRFIRRGGKIRRLVDILVHTERVRRYCLSVEARSRAAGTIEEVRFRAAAMLSASRRLSPVSHYSDAAASAHNTALGRLEASKRMTAMSVCRCSESSYRKLDSFLRIRYALISVMHSSRQINLLYQSRPPIMVPENLPG